MSSVTVPTDLEDFLGHDNKVHIISNTEPYSVKFGSPGDSSATTLLEDYTLYNREILQGDEHYLSMI